jgi:hypothetical protein
MDQVEHSIPAGVREPAGKKDISFDVTCLAVIGRHVDEHAVRLPGVKDNDPAVWVFLDLTGFRVESDQAEDFIADELPEVKDDPLLDLRQGQAGDADISVEAQADAAIGRTRRSPEIGRPGSASSTSTMIRSGGSTTYSGRCWDLAGVEREGSGGAWSCPNGLTSWGSAGSGSVGSSIS